MTYKEEAIKRLMSLSINNFEAEEILELIINQGEFAPQVFNDFEEDEDDNWDNELKLKR